MQKLFDCHSCDRAFWACALMTCFTRSVIVVLRKFHKSICFFFLLENIIEIKRDVVCCVHIAMAHIHSKQKLLLKEIPFKFNLHKKQFVSLVISVMFSIFFVVCKFAASVSFLPFLSFTFLFSIFQPFQTELLIMSLFYISFEICVIVFFLRFCSSVKIGICHSISWNSQIPAPLLFDGVGIGDLNPFLPF